LNFLRDLAGNKLLDEQPLLFTAYQRIHINDRYWNLFFAVVAACGNNGFQGHVLTSEERITKIALTLDKFDSKLADLTHRKGKAAARR
jgi:hypothetical protein